MSMLQVRNIPADLHAALAERAREEGTTMSDYVTRLLRRDLSRPSISQWLAEQRAADVPTRDIDVIGALDATRRDYDADDRALGEGRPARR